MLHLSNAISSQWPTGSQNADHHNSITLRRPTADQWKASCTSRLADQQSAELQTEIDTARRFLVQNSQGASRDKALSGLSSFEHNRVRCHPRDRSFITHFTARPLLKQFNALLKNPAIALSDRARCAETLFSALGVCDEGEASHLQDHTAELQAKLQGFSGKFQHTKVQIARQQLLALLRHHKHDTHAAELNEIHRVNGLMNSVADLVGCDVKDDAYINHLLVTELKPQAESVIRNCLTTATVVSQLSEEITELAQNTLNLREIQAIGTNSVKNTIKSGPYSHDAVAVLDQLLKSEFASELSLNDVVELSDEGTQVLLKSPTQIQQAVFNAAKGAGLIAQSDRFETVMSKPGISVQRHIQTLPALERPRHSRSYAWVLASNFLLMQRAQEKTKEEEKKRSKKSTPIAPDSFKSDWLGSG